MQRPPPSAGCCNLSIFGKNSPVSEDKDIQVDLIKLVGGDRVMRLSEPRSGLSLEMKLDPARPVAHQKQRLLSVFEAALARAELTAA